MSTYPTPGLELGPVDTNMNQTFQKSRVVKDVAPPIAIKYTQGLRKPVLCISHLGQSHFWAQRCGIVSQRKN